MATHLLLANNYGYLAVPSVLWQSGYGQIRRASYRTWLWLTGHGQLTFGRSELRGFACWPAVLFRFLNKVWSRFRKNLVGATGAAHGESFT